MLQDLIFIKKSSLKGAGKGAFARKDIATKTKLGEYSGRLIDKEAFDKLKDTLYTFEVTKKFEGRYYLFYIDASDPKHSSLLRYVNGALGKKQKKLVNVESYQYAEKIYYRACRDIKKGEELIIDYGDNYWDED